MHNTNPNANIGRLLNSSGLFGQRLKPTFAMEGKANTYLGNHMEAESARKYECKVAASNLDFLVGLTFNSNFCYAQKKRFYKKPI